MATVLFERMYDDEQKDQALFDNDAGGRGPKLRCLPRLGTFIKEKAYMCKLGLSVASADYAPAKK